MEPLPIKLPANKKEETISGKIAMLVKEIMRLKKKNEDTKELEGKIDEAVFELYGITDKERKIIENM